MSKKTFLKYTLISTFVLISFSFQLFPIRAEIGYLYPTKDTYISIDDEALSNFGMADDLEIGDGFDGICLSLICFDTSDVEDLDSEYEFSCDIIVYGAHTRTVKVDLFQGIPWNETDITGLNNPFNATDIWANDYSPHRIKNLTVGETTEELRFSFDEGYIGEITLVFATDYSDNGWINMESRESDNYFRDTPSLQYSYLPPPATQLDNNNETGNLLSLLWWIGVLGVVGVLFYYKLIKKKPSAAPKSDPNGDKHCPQCSSLQPLRAKFCSKCGYRF